MSKLPRRRVLWGGLVAVTALECLPVRGLKSERPQAMGYVQGCGQPSSRRLGRDRANTIIVRRGRQERRAVQRG